MNGLSKYCHAARQLAAVKKLGPEEGYSARIPGFPGLVVFAPTREAALAELESALDNWVDQALSRGDGLPALHDLPAAAGGAPGGPPA